MKATAENIWAVPAYTPYVQPTLTDEAVANVERSLGCRLPIEYLALLRVQNGGHIRFTIPDLDADHRVIAGIGPNFPSLTEHFEDAIPGIIPLDGDGHWVLGLDYRSNSTAPSVTLIDLEYDKQSIVARSFVDYLSLLQLRVSENEIVVLTDPESLASHIGRVLNVNFGSPESWAHGYPVWRAGRAVDNVPQWIWISPNRVSRTFARREDPSFENLQDHMRGEADRFPGVPSAASILSATEGLLANAVEACRQGEFAYCPLRDYFLASDVN